MLTRFCGFGFLCVFLFEGDMTHFLVNNDKNDVFNQFTTTNIG